MYWVITRDLIGTGDRVGLGFIPSLSGEKHGTHRLVNLDSPEVKKWVGSLPVQFRLYDDDDILYYEGRASEADFDAQDWAERNDGVTYTMWRSGNADWELL